MMLCSCLAARDLSLISSETLCEMLERTLDSVEKLPRWHGNLLNWYDTETLEALSPRFVSSVDSGNFLCCLTALSEGLSEYAPQCRNYGMCARGRTLCGRLATFRRFTIGGGICFISVTTSKKTCSATDTMTF